MNISLLKSFMALYNDTQLKLAEALKINISTLNQRMMGKKEFKTKEMKIIKKRYNLSQKDFFEIFFADEVTGNETDGEKDEHQFLT